jgi:hypothetical protein
MQLQNMWMVSTLQAKPLTMVSYGTRREGKKVFLVHIRVVPSSILHGAPPLSPWCSFTLATRLQLCMEASWRHDFMGDSLRLVQKFHGDHGKASFHDIHKIPRATLDEGRRSRDQ